LTADPSSGELIMSMQLFETESGDYRNARYLAKACDLAYFDEAQARPLFQLELGLDAKLVSVDNTQVYVAKDDKNLVVVFRGSQSPDSIDGFKDWLLTNANNYLILPEGELGTDFAAAGVGARFHLGYMGALAEIWEPLFAAVNAAQSESERLLWVTGHSLGGGLALLAAWRFQRQFLAVHEIYTFGAPMVGNAAAAEAFHEAFPGKIHRFVDCLDVVPLLPTVSLVANTYGHCLEEHELGDESNAEGGPANKVMVGMAASTVDGLLHATIIDEIWGHFHRRIASHMMANYQSQIAAKCQDR